MRDVSSKIKTLRTATAQATLKMSADTIERIRGNTVPKGNPLEVAKVAGIQAAKNTSQIIPYCHPLPIDFVSVDFEMGQDRIDVTATVKAVYKTGVEMEALTAVSVAALTLYDMLKMLDESMEIQAVTLRQKTGGKSDFAPETASGLAAGVLVISDSVSAGTREDRSGKLIIEGLKARGFTNVSHHVVPDEPQAIEQALITWSDEKGLDIVLTTGGTGLGPRDNTPEVTSRVVDRDAGAIVEAVRAYGQERTPHAMLSRARAGIRGRTLIVNLPGSPSGVQDALAALFPAILHARAMLRGEGHG